MAYTPQTRSGPSVMGAGAAPLARRVGEERALTASLLAMVAGVLLRARSDEAPAFLALAQAVQVAARPGEAIDVVDPQAAAVRQRSPEQADADTQQRHLDRLPKRVGRPDHAVEQAQLDRLQIAGVATEDDAGQGLEILLHFGFLLLSQMTLSGLVTGICLRRPPTRMASARSYSA